MTLSQTPTNQTATNLSEARQPAPSPRSSLIPVAVAHGDGIGPEIMRATLRVLVAAGAPIEPVEVGMGEHLYRQGHTSGFDPDAWETLRRTGLLLKAPITTPQGGGYKSLNVTLRKTLGLYTNVRPAAPTRPSCPPCTRRWTW